MIYVEFVNFTYVNIIFNIANKHKKNYKQN